MSSSLFTVSSTDQLREYPLIPAGTHEARLYGIVDIGTQPNNYPGATSPTKKEVILMIEFPTQTHVFKEWEPGKPFVLSRKFGKSFHKKSSLRIFLESMLGRQFTPEETTGFPLDTLIGTTFMCSVIHTENNGKKYANILTAMPLPSSVKCPPQFNETLLYSVLDHNEEAFQRLWKYTRSLVEASPEYQNGGVEWPFYTEKPKEPETKTKSKVTIDQVPF